MCKSGIVSLLPIATEPWSLPRRRRHRTRPVAMTRCSWWSRRAPGPRPPLTRPPAPHLLLPVPLLSLSLSWAPSVPLHTAARRRRLRPPQPEPRPPIVLSCRSSPPSRRNRIGDPSINAVVPFSSASGHRRPRTPASPSDLPSPRHPPQRFPGEPTVSLDTSSLSPSLRFAAAMRLRADSHHRAPQPRPAVAPAWAGREAGSLCRWPGLDRP